MMAHKRGLDRAQTALLPAAVEDYVGPAHMVRVIDAYVARLDMVALGFAKSQALATGRPPYAPDDLLRLYVYGYWQHIRSSRRLERECQRNLEVMFLVRQLVFDHKTIADFRKDNSQALQAACAGFVQFARGEGLLGSGEQAVVAIDGSKFKASAASGSVVDAGTAARRREQLAERIAEYLAQMDAADAAEADEAKIPELEAALSKLLDKDFALAVAQGQIEAKSEAPAGAGPSIKPQAGLVDPDAVKLRDGLVGYNVQQAVDTSSQLIVAHEVTQHGNDHLSLEPIAKAAQAALAEPRLTALADAGYMNGEQAENCEQAGITPVVPMQRVAHTAGEDLYPKSAFVYDPGTDTYRCPAGALLHRFKRSQTRQTDSYATTRCANCRRKARCTRAEQRTISRSWFAAATERADQRARGDRRWMRLRSSTVENRFGLLKSMLHGGFLVRGLSKVRGEMALAVLAVNLRRAANWVGFEKLIRKLQNEPAFSV